MCSFLYICVWQSESAWWQIPYSLQMQTMEYGDPRYGFLEMFLHPWALDLTLTNETRQHWCRQFRLVLCERVESVEQSRAYTLIAFNRLNGVVGSLTKGNVGRRERKRYNLYKWIQKLAKGLIFDKRLMNGAMV